MYDELLKFAVQLAKAAGGIQLAYFRGDRLSIETKSNVYDVVTRADRESEELIAGMIAERYPDHAILGEEGGCRGNAASDWRWVVDPLDGTTNYSQGLPLFTVSIALQYRGETIVGVVYAPYLNELFTATKGGGAYLQYASRESERLRVGEKQTLATSVIASGFPYDKDVNPDNTDHPLRAGCPAAGFCGLRHQLRRRRTAGRLLGTGAARMGRLRRRTDPRRGRGRRLRPAPRPGHLDRRGQRRDREGNLEVRAVNSPKTKSLQALQPILNEGGSKFPPLHMCVY